MSEASPLLPPIGLIHDRLTRNQRERRVLRTLLRLAVRTEEQARPEAQATVPKDEAPASRVARD